MVKGALARVRDGAAARGRELGEEALALQERLDAARHAAAERVEDAAELQEQARGAPTTSKGVPFGMGQPSHSLMKHLVRRSRCLVSAQSEAQVCSRNSPVARTSGLVDGVAAWMLKC